MLLGKGVESNEFYIREGAVAAWKVLELSFGESILSFTTFGLYPFYNKVLFNHGEGNKNRQGMTDQPCLAYDWCFRRLVDLIR